MSMGLVLPFHLFHHTSGWRYRDLVGRKRPSHHNSKVSRSTDFQLLSRSRPQCGEWWLPLLAG
ncbi:hypothetical protein VFPPC_15398 [Pochonia chlamydosporia 170]|uniref:Uncharacterized protein n=1 Tax=Pochonia chlamydosporia 170 TaxID=1380566 RepID=A0A179GA37_METCM|nr:hypothetical protein VFPPC_15398 [Pochonia chlamydosporia 170]OAQ74019.1 hypothetical protein VFPPC_15398 [Pochonia chlamydosporia 170]